VGRGEIGWKGCGGRREEGREKVEESGEGERKEEKGEWGQERRDAKTTDKRKRREGKGREGKGGAGREERELILPPQIDKRKAILSESLTLPYHARDHIALSALDFAQTIERGSKIVSEFYPEHVFKYFTETQKKDFWVQYMLVENDWTGFVKRKFAEIFGENFLVPREEIDAKFLLQVLVPAFLSSSPSSLPPPLLSPSLPPFPSSLLPFFPPSLLSLLPLLTSFLAPLLPFPVRSLSPPLLPPHFSSGNPPRPHSIRENDVHRQRT
jgi:hypothetical protein